MAHIEIRKAERADLERIVSLLASDAIGNTREDPSVPLMQTYVDAFGAVDADPNQLLAVVVLAGEVIGTLQLSFIPNISRKGAWRAQIEAVRIDAAARGGGVGREMFEWAFEQARQRGCELVQLTCDNARVDAQRFYESLGFVAGHVGFKKAL